MDGNINEKIGIEEPKKETKPFSRLSLLWKLLGVYLIFIGVLWWMLESDGVEALPKNFKDFVVWVYYVWYIPVASIFYGIRTSIKRENPITSSLLFLVIFEVFLMLLFLVFGIISNPGFEEFIDVWGAFAFVSLVGMGLTLASSVLCLISGYVTKLVIHLNKQRKSKIQDNVA